jgi:hypothetical protein
MTTPFAPAFGIVDRVTLDMMRREVEATFDTLVHWHQQIYETDSNGDQVAVSDLYGKKEWGPAQPIHGRYTREIQEVPDPTQIVSFPRLLFYLPHDLDIRPGDALLFPGQDFDHRPVINDVAQVPTESASVFTFVTCGVRE